MTRIKIYMAIMVCLLIWHTEMNAEELELDQVIHIAGDSTITAFRARNLFLSKYWEFRNYKASRRPSLTLHLAPMQYNRDIVKRYVSESDMDVYRTQQSLYSYGNISVNQIFALTGGKFYIDSELSFFRHFGQTTTNQFSSVPIRIGYSQSLLGYNPFKWEKLIGNLKYDYAQKELIYNLEEASVSAVSYFFNLALAECNYKLAVKRTEINRKLYNEAQERLNIQMISNTDLQTIELLFTEAKNDSIICLNATNNAKRALLSFLNMPKDKQIKTKIPDFIPVDFIPVNEALHYAKVNHPSLWEQKQRIMEAKQHVDKTSKERFMDAEINISIGFNQVADNFCEVYRKPLQQNMTAVSMTIPLIDWGIRKGRHKIAQSNLELAENTAKQAEQSVEEDIISIVNDYNAKVKVAYTSMHSIKLAENILDESMERFCIGKDDINRLNDDMLNVQNVIYGYVRTLYECWLLFYKIRQMTFHDFQNDCSIDMNIDFNKLNR